MTKYTTCISRNVAQLLRPELLSEKTCIISINEPHSLDGDSELYPNWYKVHRTRFWDVVERLPQGIALAGHPPGDIDPINEEQAKEMAAFIRENWDSNIIVHCRAGISRSAAVARVLMELGWEDLLQLRGLPWILTGEHRTNVSRANITVVNLLRHQFPEILPEGALPSLTVK